MKFDINIWNKYRDDVKIVGNHLEIYKDSYGYINEREGSRMCLEKITNILKNCSDYMNKTELKTPDPLWEYNIEDPTTHPSSKSFLYKDLMSKKAVNNYGRQFMAN